MLRNPRITQIIYAAQSNNICCAILGLRNNIMLSNPRIVQNYILRNPRIAYTVQSEDCANNMLRNPRIGQNGRICSPYEDHFPPSLLLAGRS